MNTFYIETMFINYWYQTALITYVNMAEYGDFKVIDNNQRLFLFS